MSADAAGLHAPLTDGALTLVPTLEAHREPLRAACAADPDIWPIYSVSFHGEAFDPTFDALLADPGRLMLVAIQGGAVIGMSGFLNLAPSIAGSRSATPISFRRRAAAGSTAR